MENQVQKLNVKSLHTFYLPVKNARKSADWFKHHFNAKETEASDNITLRLDEGASVSLIESAVLNHYESNPIHFKCNNAMKAYDKLDKSDIDASEPVNWHHYVDFNFKDPDGNPIGVISDSAWAPNPNNYFRIDGIFLGSVDFESTLAWFQEVFETDIEYDFTVETPSSPDARMCCLRDYPITLFESPKSFIQGKCCDFLTNNLFADYHYLIGKGVHVGDILEINGIRTLSFFDPEGREFGLVEE